MIKMKLISALILSSLLVACASQNKAPRNVAKTSQILEKEKKMREREEIEQDRKDQQKILSKKNPAAASSIKFGALPQKKKLEIKGPIPAMSASEKELYAQLVGSYDRNDEIAFFSRFQSFQAKYPHSPLADETLYLAGLMSLSNKNYGPALRYFNQVIDRYPSSNKAASSLFAKGVALKKMNLTDESRKIFRSVQKSYPGSPEAMRAELEMKILTR